MPKTFVEWCTVIGLILVLWQFSSKCRDTLKRLLLNWIAKRSRAKTEKRIRKLQTALSAIESLPVLTEFEDIVLRGFISIFLFLEHLSLLAFLSIAIFWAEPLIPTAAIFFRDLPIDLVVLLGALTAFGMVSFFHRFRVDRSSKYRETIRKNIDELEARMK